MTFFFIIIIILQCTHSNDMHCTRWNILANLCISLFGLFRLSDIDYQSNWNIHDRFSFDSKWKKKKKIELMWVEFFFLSFVREYVCVVFRQGTCFDWRSSFIVVRLIVVYSPAHTIVLAKYKLLVNMIMTILTL